MQAQDIKDGFDTLGCKVMDVMEDEETLCNKCNKSVEVIYLCTVSNFTLHAQGS